MTERAPASRYDWLDPVKALALVGVLWNHLIEAFGPGPWFTNPSNDWPDFARRMERLWPPGPAPIALARFFGWLGDSAPGVFLVASGIGLTSSMLARGRGPGWVGAFFRARLGRIFPLYVAMHFVMLAGSLLVPESDLTMASKRTLASLLGLRFTASLFYYISPAWWFVWLIIQLYLIFPALYTLLERWGARRFLAVTFAFTFACRTGFILFSGRLYYWMSGMFFGTRLGELTAGMAIAVVLHERSRRGTPAPDGKSVGAAAALLYALGFACSFTWAGSVVSNLLVTLGMTGLFYVAWTAAIRKVAILAAAATWVGAHSFSIYLVHHTPLAWTADLLPGNPLAHLAAALLVLALSFPTGRLIEGVVDRTGAAAGRAARAGKVPAKISWAVSMAALAAAAVESRFSAPWVHRALSLALGAAVLLLGYVEWARDRRGGWPERLVRWTAAAAGVLTLFLLPPGMGIAAVALGAVAAVLGLLAASRIPSRLRAWSLAIAVCGLLAGASELALRRLGPIEAGSWGELPALETHTTRVYALKPDRETHLRYNNYDYHLRTNALGLPGPPVMPGSPPPGTLRILALGDAFTMPEGVEAPRAYTTLLQASLAERLAPQRVEVVNGGVTGYGPSETSREIAELGPLLRPHVVTYQFFVNEFGEVGLNPAERLEEIGLLRGGRSALQRLVEGSQLLARLRQGHERLAERLAGKPGRWRYKKSLLEYYRPGENDLYAEPTLKALRARLTEIGDVCRVLGAKLVIYYVPAAVAVSSPDQISYYPTGENLARYDLGRPLRALTEIARELAVPVVDLTPPLRASPVQPVYFSDSWHWNEEGHRVAAQAMADTLAAVVQSVSEPR